MKHALSCLPEIDSMVLSARRVLIATDFDGTLCPVGPSPDEVRLAPGMLGALRRIAASERMMLAVISGRALADLTCRVPVLAVLAGNHGLEIAGGGMVVRNPGALLLRPALDAACNLLNTALRPWPGAWVEDKYLSATVHYRLVERRAHGSVLSAARRALASFGPSLALRAGNRSLEVRPNVNWEKGNALEFICRQWGPFDAVIALGDDRTDETMFRGLPGHVDIKVGPARPTRAAYHLTDCAEVAVFLNHAVEVSRFCETARAGAA